MIGIWCGFWSRLQDAAFWVDDKTRTAYCGNLVTELAAKLTPADY